MQKEKLVQLSLSSPKTVIDLIEQELTQYDIRNALLNLYDAAAEMKQKYNDNRYFIAPRSRTRTKEISELTQALLELINPAEPLLKENGLKAFNLLARFFQTGNWKPSSANTNLIRNFLNKRLPARAPQDDALNTTLYKHANVIKSYAAERRAACEERYQQIFHQRLNEYHNKMNRPEPKAKTDSPPLSFDEHILLKNVVESPQNTVAPWLDLQTESKAAIKAESAPLDDTDQSILRELETLQEDTDLPVVSPTSELHQIFQMDEDEIQEDLQEESKQAQDHMPVVEDDPTSYMVEDEAPHQSSEASKNARQSSEYLLAEQHCADTIARIVKNQHKMIGLPQPLMFSQFSQFATASPVDLEKEKDEPRHEPEIVDTPPTPSHAQPRHNAGVASTLPQFKNERNKGGWLGLILVGGAMLGLMAIAAIKSKHN